MGRHATPIEEVHIDLSQHLNGGFTGAREVKLASHKWSHATVQVADTV
jgi:hypothetical protein